MWDGYRLPLGWENGHTLPPNGVNPLPLDEDRAAGGEDVCGIVARRLMGGFVWLLVRFVDPPLAWVKRETMLDPDQGLSWSGGSDVLTAFETEHGMVTADRSGKKTKTKKKKKAQTAPGGGEAGAAAQSASS